jgi:hypothetical protein
MTDQPHKTPSFTPMRRWRIGLDLTVRTLLVLAVAVMVNYLSAEHFKRFFLSSQTRIHLASRTESVVRALTNQVTVTLYYDRQDDFYPAIQALLNEYQLLNPKISVQTVDYLRDPAGADKVRDQYKLAANKNLIVFDLGGRTQIVPGDTLVSYTYTNVPNEKEIEMLKKPFEFDGEMWFTTALLALENPQPLKAYFLQGHGEPSLTDTDSRRGYLTFGNVLMHDNYLSVAYLQQLGNQGVPEDCNLLIIAAPTEPLDGTELQKINQYLAQGGRLFVLLDYNSIPGIRKSADAPPARPTGLEPILHDWGIEVVADYVKDPDYTSSTLTFQDIKVQEFSKHPVMDALIAEQLPLHMIFPRPIFRRDWQNNPPPNAPEVTELAFSSAASTLYPETGVPARKYPLMAAAEQKPAAGVLNPRGSTRIVVAGDSYFLGNHYIEDVGNRDFVNSAINWLLDRTALLKGIEPQKVTSYHLLITQTQQQQLRWILLGALPGAILMLGGLVWLVRRK